MPPVEVVRLIGKLGRSVLGSGPRGRRFKSSRPDQNCNRKAGFLRESGLFAFWMLFDMAADRWLCPVSVELVPFPNNPPRQRRSF